MRTTIPLPDEMGFALFLIFLAAILAFMFCAFRIWWAMLTEASRRSTLTGREEKFIVYELMGDKAFMRPLRPYVIVLVSTWIFGFFGIIASIIYSELTGAG